MQLMKTLRSTGQKLLTESFQISMVLFKIMIPVIIVVKLLQESGVVTSLARILAPAMELVGLPGSMGLVWATTMVTNLYGGMIAFAALFPEHSLTVAQVTVLTSMMLIAHALPVELRVAQKAGPRMRAMALIRIGAAFCFGWSLNHIYQWGSWLQKPHVLFWNPPPDDPSLWTWAYGEITKLAMIFLIIVGLVTLMKLLTFIKATDLIGRLLQPVLVALGIGRSATHITVIGMTMGLSYGGGLIVREATSGHIRKKDIFFSLTLMGLSHSLIEDTLLMALLGGHLSGILFGRVLFSVGLVYLLVKCVLRLPEERFDRYFFNPRRAAVGGTARSIPKNWE